MFTKAGLLHFHELAHRALESMLQHVQTLPQASFRQPLEGFGQPSVRAQLVHLLDCEYSWVLAVQGRADEPYDWEHEADLQTPSELANHRAWVEQQTRAWLAAQTDAALNSSLTVTLGDRSHSGVPAEMMLHLLTHAFHHKGQIAAMCRLLGYPPPQTDMVWIGFQLEE